MAIATSQYTVSPPQSDGRVYITESHIDSEGAPYTFVYLSEQGGDYGARLISNAEYLNTLLADNEFESMADAT